MPAYILDLDGTFYCGDRPLPYAEEFLQFLSKNQYDYIFFTNAPENSPTKIAHKLCGMGIPVLEEHIVTSGMLAISHLVKQAGNGTKVNILGSAYLKELAADSGLCITDYNPEYVLAAYDESIQMHDIRKACDQIRNGAKYVATNPDDVIPGTHGMVPHTGAVLYAIERTTKMAPLMIGKPAGITASYFTQRFELPPCEIRVVGDRLDTDMGFARNCGFRAYLMLTGVTTPDQAGCEKACYDQYFYSLQELISYEKAGRDK